VSSSLKLASMLCVTALDMTACVLIVPHWSLISAGARIPKRPECGRVLVGMDKSKLPQPLLVQARWHEQKMPDLFGPLEGVVVRLVVVALQLQRPQGASCCRWCQGMVMLMIRGGMVHRIRATIIMTNMRAKPRARVVNGTLRCTRVQVVLQLRSQNALMAVGLIIRETTTVRRGAIITFAIMTGVIARQVVRVKSGQVSQTA